VILQSLQQAQDSSVKTPAIAPSETRTLRNASPDMSDSGGLPSPPGTHLASWYAAKLGVPVAMVNKVG